MRLQNKVAIVTGAGRGIGEGIALRLAKESAHVAVCDINLESAKATAQKIKSLGRRSLAVQADVSKSADVKRMVDEVMQEFGRIDILVNNAGITLVNPVVEFSEEDWDRLININLKGVFLCSKEVAKIMVKQKSGRIINISSDSGKTGYALFAPYNASKFGVIGFTQGLAKELAPHGVTVNAVCPGIIGTKMWEYLDEELGKRWNLPKGEALMMHIKQIPLGRLGNPEDVAKVVAFLASSDADYVTGEAVNVTGGREMH